MKRVFVVVATMGLVLGVASFGLTQEKIKIGILGRSVSPHWDMVQQGMKDAAEALDVDAVFYAPETEDAERQIATVESWIAKGFDAIAFAASETPSLIPIVEKGVELGVNFISVNTDAPATKRLLYVGTDNYTAGTIAGKKMAEILEGKGQVAVLTDTLFAINSLQRIRGFKESMSGTGVGVVESPLLDYGDPARSVELAESTLSQLPDLAGFLGIRSWDGSGAGKAVKAKGKAGKVHIVCFDTTDENLSLLKEGIIDAVIGERPYLMGYYSTTVLYLMEKLGVENTLKLFPKTPEGVVIIDTGVEVVTAGKS